MTKLGPWKLKSNDINWRISFSFTSTASVSPSSSTVNLYLFLLVAGDVNSTVISFSDVGRTSTLALSVLTFSVVIPWLSMTSVSITSSEDAPAVLYVRRLPMTPTTNRQEAMIIHNYFLGISYSSFNHTNIKL